MNRTDPSPRIFLADQNEERSDELLDILNVFLEPRSVTQHIQKLCQDDCQQILGEHDLFVLDREQLRTLTGYSRKLCNTIANLTMLATRDQLTGMLNRHAFEEIFHQYHSKAAERKIKISCCVCDLDNFKDVNDTLGHKEGDIFLTQVCKMICENLRQTDLAARFGGDEFLLLFVDNSAADIKRICRRIQDELIWNFGHYDDARSKVTISFGLSEFDPENPVCSDDLIDQADIALYKAKQSGKNCTVVYDRETCPPPHKAAQNTASSQIGQ